MFEGEPCAGGRYLKRDASEQSAVQLPRDSGCGRVQRVIPIRIQMTPVNSTTCAVVDANGAIGSLPLYDPVHLCTINPSQSGLWLLTCPFTTTKVMKNGVPTAMAPRAGFWFEVTAECNPT